MAAYDYTCEEINEMFLSETGRFMQNTLARRLSPMGRWRNAIPFDSWQDGMGTVHNSIVWERTVPSNDGDEWTENTPSTGDASSQCDRVPEIIQFGQSTRSWRKSSRNIQTPWFCLEDLRDEHRVKDMLAALDKNLGWVTHYVWENRIQDEYERMSEHKVTENATMNLEGTSFSGANPPTSKLLLGTLRQIYEYLMGDGAGAEGGIGLTVNGAPIMQLFTDGATIEDLVRQDPSQAIDFRYDPDKVKILTKAYGMERAHDRYQYVLNTFQPRYTIDGGVITRVQPYTDPMAATKGVRQNFRKEYLYAPYAKSYIVMKQVMTMEVPKAITNPGGRLTFPPIDYMGQFAWLNLPDYRCNPRGEKGFFDAVFASAARPDETWYGWTIFHRRCPPKRTGENCYENQLWYA